MNRTAALHTFTTEMRERGVQPGTLDCALFIAEWVYILTGVDHAFDWRGTYKTLDEGKAKLAEIGYEDHVALVASILEEIPVLMAQTGDVAVVVIGDETGLGIVGGSRIWVLRPDHGLGHVRLSTATRMFRP